MHSHLRFSVYIDFNSKTGESSWEKPALLGSGDLGVTPRSKSTAVKLGKTPRKTPRVKAADMTRDEAASKLQSLFRRRAARKQVRKLLSQVYEKTYDADTGAFYCKFIACFAKLVVCD